MNNDNSTFEFENRTYINPDVSRDEQMAFIDTMRDIQAQNNAQIATETHNLGTDIESTRGGLSGSEEYWKSLYQTPQTNAAVANMKAVAQQSALNDALSNYQSMLQNRYNQAYRDYQKRAYNYSRKNSGNGTTDSSDDDKDKLKITTEDNASDEITLTDPKDDGLTPIADGYYSYKTGTRNYVISGADNVDRFNLQGDMRLTNPYQNQLFQKNGRTYIYTNGAWYRVNEVGDLR